MTIPDSVLVEWIKIGDPEHPHPRRGWGLVVVSVVFYVLMLAVVVARLNARLRLQKNAGYDDLLIVIALVPLTGLAVVTGAASRIWGYDRHTWDLDETKAVNSTKSALAIEFCFMFGTSLTKISVLMFYRRIVDTPISRRALYVVWAAIVFILLYLLSFVLSVLLICQPLHSYWDQSSLGWVAAHPYGRDWRCGNVAAGDVTASCLSITQDFLACFLPSLALARTRLPRRQKIALWCIIGVGYLVCAVGLVRLALQVYTLYGTYDIVWWAWWAWVFTVVEAFVAVMCASAPALKVYFERFLVSSGSRSANNEFRFGVPTEKTQEGGRRLSNGGMFSIFHRTDMKGSGAGVQPVSSASSDAEAAGDASKSPRMDYYDLELGGVDALKDEPSRSNSEQHDGAVEEKGSAR